MDVFELGEQAWNSKEIDNSGLFTITTTFQEIKKNIFFKMSFGNMTGKIKKKKKFNQTTRFRMNWKDMKWDVIWTNFYFLLIQKKKNYNLLKKKKAIKTNDGIVLIDCGIPFLAKSIYQELKDTFEEMKTGKLLIHTIIFTHGHVDHCGGSSVLRGKKKKKKKNFFF